MHLLTGHDSQIRWISHAIRLQMVAIYKGVVNNGSKELMFMIEVRPLTMDDAPAYQALTLIPEVAQAAGLRALTDDESRDAAISRIVADATEWAVTLDDRFIGMIGLYPRVAANGTLDAHSLELGYALDPQYWGQGLMHQALTQQLASLPPTITAVWAGVFPDNQRSIKLLARLGFTYQFSVPLPQGLSGNAAEEAYYRWSR